MKVAITGGNGFIGRRVAASVLGRGRLVGPSGVEEAVDDVVLIDAVARDDTPAGCRQAIGDIADTEFLADCLEDEPYSIFHLAAIVSADAEAHFDKGMRVNLDATRGLIERARGFSTPPRFVFASSVAVYGVVEGGVDDDTALWPLSSYGTQKAIGELLVNDATRKGFVDGRSFRLPTIAIRPGKPNKAASSFVSGVVREPLNGQNAACPVDPETRVWIASPSVAVSLLVDGHDLDGAVLGYPRTVSLPGISVSIADMIDAMVRAGGDGRLIDYSRDAAIERIVASWPQSIDTPRAAALGFHHDAGIDAIVAEYKSDAGLT